MSLHLLPPRGTYELVKALFFIDRENTCSYKNLTTDAMPKTSEGGYKWGTMVEIKGYTSCLLNLSLNKHMLDSFAAVNCASH